jgi:hypothetical protein
MKKLLILVLTLSLQTLAFGQWAIPANMRASNTLTSIAETGVPAGSTLYGLPGSAGGVIGDYYLNKRWNKASILLYKSETMIEGYPIKYDIKNELIEIQTTSGIKILDVRKIKNLVWTDSMVIAPQYFVNANEFKKGKITYSGLLEVLVDGPLPLLKRTELDVREPNYVPALDVGSKDTKILRKSVILCSKGGELIEVKNKKDVLEVSGEMSKEVDDYIKKNKLNVSKDSGMIRAFEFINSKS